MTLILDASIALKWVLAEPDSAAALQLRNDLLGGHRTFVAPDHFPYEIGYALTKAERRRAIKIGEAAEFAAKIFASMPELYPAIDLLDRAINISSGLRVGLYDCLYLALAEQESVPLLTGDLKLAAAARGQFPVLTLADLE
jgi:predicted nucleic acid-binding protein